MTAQCIDYAVSVVVNDSCVYFQVELINASMRKY